jgi:hypothetical protein
MRPIHHLSSLCPNKEIDVSLLPTSSLRLLVVSLQTIGPLIHGQVISPGSFIDSSLGLTAVMPFKRFYCLLLRGSLLVKIWTIESRSMFAEYSIERQIDFPASNTPSSRKSTNKPDLLCLSLMRSTNVPMPKTAQDVTRLLEEALLSVGCRSFPSSSSSPVFFRNAVQI